MTKTFIRLSGRNNENRASLISQLHTALTLKYGREKDELCDYILLNDLISTFKINNEKIGLISHQNPSQEPNELIEKLILQSCTVILFTSINTNPKRDEFNSILRHYNFRTINLTPFWSQAESFDYLTQIEVENIIELIETLTESLTNDELPDKSSVLYHKGNLMLQNEIQKH